MSSQGIDFTVVELKAALRAKGLPSRGSKAELIQRLEKIGDPDVWTELSRQLVEWRSTGASSAETESEPGETPLEEAAMKRMTAGPAAAARERGGASSALLGDLERAELNLLRRESCGRERD